MFYIVEWTTTNRNRKLHNCFQCITSYYPTYFLLPFSQAKQTTIKKDSQEEQPVASGKENVSENIPDKTTKPAMTNPFKKQEKAIDTPPKKQSALQLWLADNEKAVKEKYPDASEKELLAKAAMMFKDVDSDTKQVCLIFICVFPPPQYTTLNVRKIPLLLSFSY